MASDVQIILGNCLDVLRDMAPESVDCCVTSPPYWSLRDYGLEPLIYGGARECEHEWSSNGVRRMGAQRDHDGKEFGSTRGNEPKRGPTEISLGETCQKCGAWKGQLGLEPTPELYVKDLVSIFDEVKRVLKKTGTCWVVIGDTYAGSWGNYGARAGSQRSKRTDSFGRGGQPRPDMLPPSAHCGLPDKCLCQTPARFAIAMTERGWILRNRIIWSKPNTMPSSVKDRFTVDFEDLFFFSKSKRYNFEKQLEPLTYPERTGHKFGDNRAESYGPRQYSGNTYKAPAGGRNKRTTWTISTCGYNGAHFAVFPPQLVETPIKAGCPQGGVVLDPFGGSGTTAMVAQRLGRRSIVIEANPQYKALIEERTGQARDREPSEVSS